MNFSVCWDGLQLYGTQQGGVSSFKSDIIGINFNAVSGLETSFKPDDVLCLLVAFCTVRLQLA